MFSLRMFCCHINRAPITAESIKQAVNEVLSGEPGYRAATDAEFEDLLWAGFSHSGAEVRLQRSSLAHHLMLLAQIIRLAVSTAGQLVTVQCCPPPTASSYTFKLVDLDHTDIIVWRCKQANLLVETSQQVSPSQQTMRPT